MDVKFTNSSGIQMPLANIVESGNNYVRFENGIQIVYKYERPTAVVSDDVVLNGYIVYPKPFISSPTTVFGKNKLVLYKKSHMGFIQSYMTYYDNDVVIVYDSFSYNGNEINVSEGFSARVTSTESLIAQMINGKFFIDYIAIGKWK